MAVTTINIDSQVLTFANLAAFPITGTVKTIYIAEDTNFQYYWDGTAYELLTTDILIPANLTFYATTAPSPIMGYSKLVISIDDPDYDNPAVDVSTGAISGTAQLIAELASDAGIFAGNPGVITISTVGEIRRTAGSGGAEFYFEIYQRDSGGVETLRGTSNKTTSVTANVYQQFQASCLFNNGTWTATDRVVLKFYGDKVGGGSNPTYDFLFGGTNPVRTLFPISAQLLLNVPITIGTTSVTGGTNGNLLSVDVNGKLAQTGLTDTQIFVGNASNVPAGVALSLNGTGGTFGLANTGILTFPNADTSTRGLLTSSDWNTFNNKVPTGLITSSGLTMNTARLLGRGTAGVGAVEEIVIGSGLTLTGTTLSAAGGSGITIGTTAIASGTVGRVLFEGAGNVVQQSSNFFWDNTNGRLGIRVATPTASLEVLGAAPSGTTQSFAVHNSTGTNNALVVLDNSNIGFGVSSPTAISGVTSLWQFGTGAGVKAISLAGNNASANPAFIRFRIEDGGNASKIIEFDNNLGAGVAGVQIRQFSSSPAKLFIQNNANNTLQELEIRDGNETARAVLSAGATAANLILVRSGTTSIRISDNNSNDSFWNPTGVRTFIFGATTRTNASALVEMTSTTRGFLPPRNANPAANITTPAEGLICFDTTDKKLQVYDGTNWIDLH
jgi:hypothetical protein